MNVQDLEELFSSGWAGVVERCHRSLQPEDIHALETYGSWDSVRMSILDVPGGKASFEFTLLKPSLSHLSSFTHTFETELGSKLSASFLWGSIGILLQVRFYPTDADSHFFCLLSSKVTSEDHEAAETILRMIRSMGHTAGIFNTYRAALPRMVDQVKEACFNIQMELVEFCVDAIRYMRGDNESGRHQSSIQFDALAHASSRQDLPPGPIEIVEKRYSRMSSELEKMLVQVEKLVQFNLSLSIHAIPTNAEASRALRIPDKKPTYHLLPRTGPLRFFGRADIFERLDNVFDNEPWASLRSVALWGLGGIGKSFIALQYIETKVRRGTYDATLWVHAEDDESIRQSFTDIALKLKLAGASPQTHGENLELVQDWFQSTDYRWLLVYDDVPSTGIPTRYWPISRQGHVIITTRMSSVAFAEAGTTIEVTLDDMMGSEFLMFLLKEETGNDPERDRVSTQEPSHRLGGYPPAISHMARVIHPRSLTIPEFLRIYLNNTMHLHGSVFKALWGFSFQALDDPAHAFLGVLSFLMPDHIPQSLFEPKKQLPKSLEFCNDEFGFSEVIERLLDASLIKRNRTTRAFSIHRMVQIQFIYLLDQSQLQRRFEDAVSIIYQQFPRMTDENGQLYAEWTQCNALLQHVISLKESFRACHNSNKNFKAPLQFCELLKDCQRYLYESNAFDELDDMCDVNLVAVETLDDKGKINALLPHIYSQQANMHEGLGNAEKSIELNKKGYQIRLNENPINQVLCYGFESNIGYTYNTANKHQDAMEWFEKARNRWIEFVDENGNQDSYPAILKKNMARCFFYMDDLPKARSLLDTAIAEFQAEKPFNWGMMAYAYHVMGLINRKQGDLEAAEANLIKARDFWSPEEQDKSNPFYGGCVYKAGVVCLDRGNKEAAVKHLRESLVVTGSHKDKMPVEFARNCFKLSEALLLKDSLGNRMEAEELRKHAEEYLKKRDPAATAFSTEDAYDQFVPIFWR
ncbi:hypothetical protein O1611_g2307 [Lasiodiplodia mahajangana]|uniref:Uncharacterized protein n=1 Tax=Lasiodiplodia mahajangana TaxID=1108764 RepID=A0ACC2JUZ2_9PEZI|nr:hypothetical protein O1611_g2307 [Lasiodiplodia mahajangana]